MIPLDLRCAVMKSMDGIMFEGVAAEYESDAVVDVAGAKFKFTEYGTLHIRAGNGERSYGFYPPLSDLELTRKKFRVAVARALGIDWRRRKC